MQYTKYPNEIQHFYGLFRFICVLNKPLDTLMHTLMVRFQLSSNDDGYGRIIQCNLK